jgi:hypothetical protein
MHMAMYSPLKGLLIAIKNKKNVDLMNNYMKSLNAEMCQDLVFVAPLMTMIDSLLLALLDDKAVIKQPSELFKYSVSSEKNGCAFQNLT